MSLGRPCPDNPPSPASAASPRLPPPPLGTCRACPACGTCHPARPGAGSLLILGPSSQRSPFTTACSTPPFFFGAAAVGLLREPITPAPALSPAWVCRPSRLQVVQGESHARPVHPASSPRRPAQWPADSRRWRDACEFGAAERRWKTLSAGRPDTATWAKSCHQLMPTQPPHLQPEAGAPGSATFHLGKSLYS